MWQVVSGIGVLQVIAICKRRHRNARPRISSLGRLARRWEVPASAARPNAFHKVGAMSLFAFLQRAASGSFPADNGDVKVLPSPSGYCDAVVALTGQSIVAAGVAAAWVEKRVPRDDLTGPMRPDFVAALAGKLGTNPGSVDVLLAAPRLESSEVVDLVKVDEGDARTARARRYRTEVQSYTDREGGVINLGRGVDGRLDLSIELPPEVRSMGRGRKLIEAARTLVPPDEFLFASIAPGNARCLRAALAAGFAPLGGEVLFLVRPPSST
jgi:hypothetical protein